MKRTNRLFWKITFLIMVSVAISCKKKINTRTDLIAYLANPENGLIKTQEINQIKAELRYKPWQLMRIDHNQSQKQSGQYTEDVLKNKYFFVLNLSTNNKELLRQLPFAQYSEMLQVLSFRMMAYIDIRPDENKPIAPEDCLFQQTYGMTHSNQLLLVFDKTKLKNAKHLQIKVKEFGLGIGDLNFQMNTHDIYDLPVAALN
jgi:hypothetical protein